MSNAKLIRQSVLNFMREMGTKSPLMDDAARAVIGKKAANVGLPDVVYHSSPHGFSSIRGGEDQFIHVAEDPRVALDRLNFLKDEIKEPIFDLTPEAAKRLQATKKDIEKGGYLYEMFTKLGNPLDIRDFGQFNVSNLLAEQKNIRELLDDSTRQELQRLVNAGDEIIEKYENTTSPKLRAALANLMHDIEKEQARVLSSALREKGYDSLRYRNTFEVPQEYDKIKDNLRDITLKITKLDKNIDELVAKGADKSLIAGLKDEKLKLRSEYETLEKQMPLSYALFPDTPTRHTAADFAEDKIKSDPNDLLASLGLATGTGLAASTMIPEDAEAALISRAEDIAKVVTKLKNPTASELARKLNYPRVISSAKQIGEIHDATSNLLDVAIRHITGSNMSDSPEKVTTRWINLARPELKGKIGDTIIGIGDPRGAREQYVLDRAKLLRKYNPRLSRYDARMQAEQDIANSAGIYGVGADVHELPSGEYLFSPGKAYVFDNSPSTAEHEINHWGDHITRPEKFEALNSSYSLSPNPRFHFKESPQDAINRFTQFAGISSEELFNDLSKKGLLEIQNDGKKIIPADKIDKVGNYLTNRFKLLPSTPNYSFGNHFFNYNHFEPERASEILSDRLRMFTGNPLENEMALRGIAAGEFSPEEIPEIMEKMKQRGKLEEVPMRFIDYKKRQFERPVYDKPKFLNESQNRRLSELEKEFEGEDF